MSLHETKYFYTDRPKEQRAQIVLYKYAQRKKGKHIFTCASLRVDEAKYFYMEGLKG